MIKKLRAIGISALALVAGLGIVILPASASAAAYTPQGLCGAGYSVRRSHALPQAKTYELTNGSTNCVVTIKNAGSASYGKPTRLIAGLQNGSGNWGVDAGDYKYYAGPVYQAAKGKCVYTGYHAGQTFTSAPKNCK